MIKYIIYFCFSVIFLSSLHAQTVIKGQCKTKTGNTIDFASIVLSDSSGEVLAFTTTDSSGKFSLAFNTKWDSLVLSFSHMYYEDAHKKIANQSQTVSFLQIIERKDKVLQEVLAQSVPITNKGDSIDYLAEKFITQRDRTLEDILKKMPGIDVDASGRIKFQGVSINKFYVENKDLMGGSYDMISKSMPVGDVRMAQVLPRYQPIGILKDKIPSPYPAINIKLKEKYP